MLPNKRKQAKAQLKKYSLSKPPLAPNCENSSLLFSNHNIETLQLKERIVQFERKLCFHSTPIQFETWAPESSNNFPWKKTFKLKKIKPRKESRPQAKVKLEEDTKSIAKWKSKQKSEQKVTPLMIDEIEPEKIDKNFDVWFIAKDFRPNDEPKLNSLMASKIPSKRKCIGKLKPISKEKMEKPLEAQEKTRKNKKSLDEQKGIVIKPTRIPRPKKSNTEKQKTSSRKFSSNEVQKEVVRLSSPKISDNVKKISPEVDDDWNQIFEFQRNDYLSLEHPTCTPETNILIVHGEGAGDDNQDYYPSDFEADVEESENSELDEDEEIFSLEKVYSDEEDESCEEVSEDIQLESDAENLFEIDHLKEIIVGMEKLKTASYSGKHIPIK